MICFLCCNFEMLLKTFLCPLIRKLIFYVGDGINKDNIVLRVIEMAIIIEIIEWCNASVIATWAFDQAVIPLSKKLNKFMRA